MNYKSRLAPGLPVPMVVCSSDWSSLENRVLLDRIDGSRNEIIEQVTEYGAVLFRGFGCQNEEYFSKAIELCGLGNRCNTADYDLPRTLLPDNIYTSSDLPAHIPLPLHHEKPRSKNPPHHIYFCCVTPAPKGGGTIFANAQAIWQDMPNGIREKLIEHGVTYRQFFHGGSVKYTLVKKALGAGSARSWSDHFGSSDKRFIEKKLKHEAVDWRWLNRGKDLIVLNCLPGALNHPLTHKTSWFNASAYLNFYANLLYGDLKSLRSYQYLASRYLIFNDRLPMVCHYGNGQPFSAEEISVINQVIERHTCVLNWQKGDFMIVDNYTFMHGKQPHQGDRLLYSCMTMP